MAVEDINLVLKSWKVPQQLENVDAQPPLTLKIFGIFWTEEEFVKVAQNACHPLAPELAIPDVLLKEVQLQSLGDDSEVAKNQSTFLEEMASEGE